MSAYFGKGYRRVLDLGIYRCGEEQYWAEQKADIDAYILAFGLDPEQDKRAIASLRQHWSEKYSGSWLGNETVGFISICAARAHLGAVFYHVNGRITKRMVRKRCFLRGKLFEFNTLFPEPRSSQEIYQKLRQELHDSIADLPSLGRRVIDLEPLETLGPYIDWAALTSSPGYQ